MKTRETASEGFRHALALHHTSYTPPQQDPALVGTMTRQGRCCELGARAFPDTKDGEQDRTATSRKDIRAEQRQANDSTRVAAILRAPAERAGRPVSSASLRQAG
ncbi:hypothetical protein [Streptomyces sp. NPDC094032]|uniref:hypothetical protein n=1 Tax=Streptomyces sp. NPDC094032 TaxID=3155308 RepID=UPI003331692D